MDKGFSAFSFASNFVSVRSQNIYAKSPRRRVLQRLGTWSTRRVVASAISEGPALTTKIPLRVQVVESPLRAGIKSIAIGKEGTRPIPPDLIDPIVAELNLLASVNVSDMGDDDELLDMILLRASFMGSLFVKESLNESEMQILCMACNEEFACGRVREAHGMKCSSGEVLAYIASGYMPMDPQGTILNVWAYRMLNAEPLTQEEAEDLGGILYLPRGLSKRTALDLYQWSNMNREGTQSLKEMEELVDSRYPTLSTHPSTKAEKALIAHVMRIRHETAEEIAGLARAAQRTLSDQFRVDANENALGNGAAHHSFVHLAEPFDGTVTWDLITPLLARHLRLVYGFRTVMSSGESAGPKYGPNLLSVLNALGVPLSRNAEELRENCESEYGAAVQQSDVSPGLADWVRTRRVILKRPSIATVEKYVDPAPGGAAVFVGSAFHGAYVEKMAAAAEALSYPAYVIVGNGMEGTIGLGVGPRRTGLFLLGLRSEDGTYTRESVNFSAADAGVEPFSEKPPKGSASASATAAKIQRFVNNDGSSGDTLFDARVQTTLAGFDVVFRKISKHFGAVDERRS